MCEPLHSQSTYSDTLPPIMLHLLRTLQTGLPSGDQAFKCPRLRGTFITQTTTAPGMSERVPRYLHCCGDGHSLMVGPVSFLLHLAPSPPTIKTEAIRSCEEAALICWESGNLNPVDSYTVELIQAETPEASGVTE